MERRFTFSLTQSFKRSIAVCSTSYLGTLYLTTTLKLSSAAIGSLKLNINPSYHRSLPLHCTWTGRSFDSNILLNITPLTTLQSAQQQQPYSMVYLPCTILQNHFKITKVTSEASKTPTYKSHNNNFSDTICCSVPLADFPLLYTNTSCFAILQYALMLLDYPPHLPQVLFIISVCQNTFNFPDHQ